MSGWTGFTDEDLKELKSTTVEKTSKEQSLPQLSKEERKKQRMLQIKERKLRKAQEEAKLEEEAKIQATQPAPVMNKENSAHSNDQITPKSQQVTTSEISPADTLEEVDIQILSDDKVQELERSNLENLQIRQKIIEDQNKKKKKLIKDTLQQRFKETKHEAQRLNEVQLQLQHLDKLLQKDVSMLRDKIELASLLFTQAEHRYSVAEKEYVEAKLDFFKKKEDKEQLTEHLYSIIQENEERKSKKLEELLVKLSTTDNPIQPNCENPTQPSCENPTQPSCDNPTQPSCDNQTQPSCDKPEESNVKQTVRAN